MKRALDKKPPTEIELEQMGLELEANRLLGHYKRGPRIEREYPELSARQLERRTRPERYLGDADVSMFPNQSGLYELVRPWVDDNE